MMAAIQITGEALAKGIVTSAEHPGIDRTGIVNHAISRFDLNPGDLKLPVGIEQNGDH